MSQATCWIKKIEEKKFQIFFIFHRGDPYDFSKKISQKIFLKNHKGPPYEKWKKYEIFFFNFFCPKCSLGHPKMPVRSFFEKSLTNFECVLFVRPRILTTSPFFLMLFNDFWKVGQNCLVWYSFGLTICGNSLLNSWLLKPVTKVKKWKYILMYLTSN